MADLYLERVGPLAKAPHQVLSGCDARCDAWLMRKVLRKISVTNGETDGRTDRAKTVYPPPPLRIKYENMKALSLTT